MMMMMTSLMLQMVHVTCQVGKLDSPCHRIWHHRTWHLATVPRASASIMRVLWIKHSLLVMVWLPNPTRCDLAPSTHPICKTITDWLSKSGKVNLINQGKNWLTCRKAIRRPLENHGNFAVILVKNSAKMMRIFACCFWNTKMKTLSELSKGEETKIKFKQFVSRHSYRISKSLPEFSI